MPNPVLGTKNLKPAPVAGFTHLNTLRGHKRDIPRTKKRFFVMQYRSAKIYPLDSFQQELDEQLELGIITKDTYLLKCRNIPFRALSIKKWFAYFSYQHPKSGKFIRIKVYEEINRYKSEAKIQYAKDLKKAINLSLQTGYNPFEIEILAEEIRTTLDQEIVEQKEVAANSGVNMVVALNQFLLAKIEMRKSKSTLSAYTTTANFVKNWLNKNNLLLTPAKLITGPQYLEILKEEANNQSWENKTYNNYLLYLETILNWMAKEINGRIIPYNPIKGAEQKPILSNKPAAYTDQELQDILKAVRLKKDCYMEGIILTCYYAAVRSKAEMRGLKIENILFDRDLLLLSADATKARREDYIPLDPMLKEFYIRQGWDKLPKNYFVFSNDGVGPGPYMAGQNFYATLYKPYRLKLNIPENKKLYNWKHTRALHLGLAKTNIYAIKQLFRHKTLQETENYMRDLGLTINFEAVQNSREI